MRICFVLEYYYPHVGGAERLFQNLAEGLVRKGHHCDVVTVRLPGTPAEEVVGGVHIHRVLVPQKGDRYWFTLFALPQVWKYTKRADIVQTTTYNGAPPAWLSAKARGKPVVLFVHEVIGKRWHLLGIGTVMSLMYRAFENLILSLPFDAFMCNSKSTLEDAKNWGVKEEKLFFAYPGIDHTIFDPSKNGKRREEIRKTLGVEEKFVYLYFGRPGFTKGIDYLVRAIPLIKRRIPDSVALLILAKRPEKGFERVASLIDELGLKRGEDVLILDPLPVEELPYYIKASDCVVVPSLTEGFGFTCVEACTMEVPVVASSAGSLPEVVSGRFVLVEPASPQALAEGVEKVYHGEYNSTEKRLFLWDDMVNAHIELYERLLKKRL